jgi:hypothetical protein
MRSFRLAPMPRARLLCAAGIAATLLALAARAQNFGGAEQAGSGALAERVTELEERLKKLEERLEKPLTVKAPFVVADGSGKAVLRVSKSSSEALLELTSGPGHASLKARNDGASYVSASNGKNYARLISIDASAAVEVQHGSEIGQLSIYEGRSRLKLWKSGKPYFLATSSENATLQVGDEASPGFQVRVDAEDASIRIAKGKAFTDVSAGPEGSAIHVRNGQSSGAQMNAVGENALVKVHSALGGDGVQLAMRADKPFLSMFTGGKPVAELGAPETRSTGLRFFDPQGNLALQAGLGSDGKPSVSLYENDQGIAQLMMNNSGEGVLQLFRSGEAAGTLLGREDSSKGYGLRIFDASGAIALGAGLDEKGVPSVRVMRDGKVATSMDALSTGEGLVEVMKAGKVVASLMVAKDGSGALDVSDKVGETIAWLGAEGGEGSLDLFRAGGKASASLGVEGGRKTALRIYGDTVPVAAIGVDTNGSGAMRITDSAGNAMAQVIRDSDGAGSIVTYDTKGSPSASLAATSDGSGAIQIYGGGQVLGSLARGQNGGMLQLNDNAGAPMVEAGNIGSVGVVRAGPIIKASGMPGLPGSFIIGRTE